MANDYYRQFGGASASHLTKQTIGMARPGVYAVDGVGRDTYIERDNGGFYKPRRPASAMTVGSFRSVRPSETNLCHLGSKRSNYHYNGTGRDSYIG